MTHDLLNIVSALQTGDYSIQLTFDDGRVQNVDFEKFLRCTRHPHIRAYLNPLLFSSFQIVHGELVWGDYDLCFPIIDLYNNDISHTSTLLQVA